MSAEPGRPSLWERGQRGWPPSFPLAQFPNAPLLVAIVALVLATVLSGSAQDYARAAFYVALASWAWLELTEGANLFRRLLGAAVLALVVVRVGEALGA